MKTTKTDENAPIYRGRKVFSQGQGSEESKRNWGEPLKIAIAVIDKACPECGKRNGLRLIYESGRIFGGRCHICGWSFGIATSGLSEGGGIC